MSANPKMTTATDLLALYPTSEGGKWISDARASAAKRFSDMGTPIKRDEYWKYTDPSALTSATTTAALFENDEAQMFDGVDRLKICYKI